MLQIYRDLSLSVIPVKGKQAVVPNWSRWCLELPPYELVDQWVKRFPYPEYGIALCAGPASGIDALDVDSDSIDILNLCPRSPLSRYGSRGHMTLWQHDPKVVKRKQDRDNRIENQKPTEGIQVLSTGNYLVLPPSIHPDTGKPYRWLTNYSLENFSVLDLEILDKEAVEDLVVHIRLSPLAGRIGSAMGAAGGRNNHLAIACYAKIMECPEKTDEQLAEELLQFDEAQHTNAYFHDQGEMYYRKALTAYGRSLLFVRGSRARINKKQENKK